MNSLVSESDHLLIAAIQPGLPFVARPYAAIGEQIGMSEAEVISRLSDLIQQGVIKRFGVVVRHRQLGYHANAMVVWDIPDAQISEIGHQVAKADCVTLCYRRPRQLPEWRYNLFCMIHGHDKPSVLAKIADLIEHYCLSEFPYQVLFSSRCFKQRGAVYSPQPLFELIEGNIFGELPSIGSGNGDKSWMR